jgi:hypothetical protein
MGSDHTRHGHRLKAATLLESVLAMGLMAGALSFAVGMYSRTLAADRSSDRLLAWAITEAVIATRDQVDQPAPPAPPHIAVDIQEQVIAPGLVQLTIRCSRGERTLLTRSVIQPLRP